MTDAPSSAPARPGHVVNALEREVILHGLRSIAHEMAVTVANCAISQVVRDNLDFSTAVFDARGRTVAQGLSIPLHLGAMPTALVHARATARGEVRRGDVYLLNDPDQGGMHLPDIFVFRPVFAGDREDEPALWVGCVAHHADVGGRFPGGNAVDGTHIYEEGLQLPPIRLVRDGVVDANVGRIIERNVRVPAVVWTDLSAQLAALADAETRCRDLLSGMEPTRSRPRWRSRWTARGPTCARWSRPCPTGPGPSPTTSTATCRGVTRTCRWRAG